MSVFHVHTYGFPWQQHCELILPLVMPFIKLIPHILICIIDALLLKNDEPIIRKLSYFGEYDVRMNDVNVTSCDFKVKLPTKNR